MFHHISGEHLHRYINEFAGRHSIRDCDTADMVGIVAENMAGQRLVYHDLITPGGLGRICRGPHAGFDAQRLRDTKRYVEHPWLQIVCCGSLSVSPPQADARRGRQAG